MHGFRPRKAWGQNFIFNADLLNKIAKGCKGICLEIGPGPGGLTRELSKNCDRVVAIEIDSKLCTILDNTMRDYSNVKIINADFMKADLHVLWEEHLSDEFIVAANLPYYITTPVIMKLIDSGLPIKFMRIMVQKEVAQRIVSAPGKKDYGVLSLMIQSRARTRILFDVAADMFSPPPCVVSSLVQIDMLEKPAILSDINDFRKCVRAGFSSRRKQLANNISNIYQINKADVHSMILDLGLNKDIRAERLSVDDFDRMCMRISEMVLKQQD